MATLCSQCGKPCKPRTEDIRCFDCRVDLSELLWVHSIKNRYGLTPNDYYQMLEGQHGVCAICGGTDDIRLSVDHDHETGLVRGLLCNFCNQLLGRAKESVEILENAITYLQKNKV